MAKDTEKLIRELSLISFLRSVNRPVSALEIKQDVEGYSEMNDDAFARRFYADRAELESLGIKLEVDKPSDGYFEAELYSLPAQNYHLPSINFTDEEVAALQTALFLLDGTFAYAAPLRLALQQLTWGRSTPLKRESQSVAVAVNDLAENRELAQRLAKIETAISRRKTVEFSYYTVSQDSEGQRKVDPYHLLYQDSQFYLIGYSHEREDVRVFRLSRIRSKVSYATKAEHDFRAPEDFDPAEFANRVPWQLGTNRGTARIWFSERVAWLVERDFASYGSISQATKSAPGAGILFETEYASEYQLLSWVFSFRDNAQVIAPDELVAAGRQRVAEIAEAHGEPFKIGRVKSPSPKAAVPASGAAKGDPAIRPERFARLVTLAGILIEAAKDYRRVPVIEACERLQLSVDELREDLDLLNVVNFGGGSYVLYAEINGSEIEVDPYPYGDSFTQPAKLQPLEAKALVAAIDLLGNHLPEGSLTTAREKIVEALGSDPSTESLQIVHTVRDDTRITKTVNRGIAEQRVLEIEYYKPNEDEYTERTIEPHALVNGREGWYVVSYDLERGAMRHFRLDRIKGARLTRKSFNRRPEIDPLDDIAGWPRTGRLPAAQAAKVWISPERARWARETRAVVGELADGSVIVEIPYAGTDYLVGEIFKEAGEAVVLEPEEARQAVFEAVSANSPKPKRAAKPHKKVTAAV